MEQTLAEKLRILADAAEAGETHLTVGGINTMPLLAAAEEIDSSWDIQRIQPKPATIKVGKMEINAPLRVMPKDGDRYWWISGDGAIIEADYTDESRFNNANVWATKSDAEAYRDASLAVRKGEV